MISVTKPFLPPIDVYQNYLEEIWGRNWLTNNGPLVNKLELSLKSYFDSKHVLFTTNGTIGLQIALNALDIQGEVITTPFSYVATTSSIAWEGCTPVFVDIDKDSLNLDPKLIENAITDSTSAIMATHVFGNPCDIDAIDSIAKKHGLRVIYDAAHCFGSLYKGKSVLSYGDISVISFHATKLFHTIEGGAVVTSEPDLLKKMVYLRNFGHDGPERFNGIGINGKNSEFHAAMGLANLNYVDHILKKREKDHRTYDKWLNQLQLGKVSISDFAKYNYSYYPVIFKTEEDCLKVFNALMNSRIGSRRYFNPVLSKLDYVKPQNVPIATSVSERILCLPLYEQLSDSEIELVCRIILRTLKN